MRPHDLHILLGRHLVALEHAGHAPLAPVLRDRLDGRGLQAEGEPPVGGELLALVQQVQPQHDLVALPHDLEGVLRLAVGPGAVVFGEPEQPAVVVAEPRERHPLGLVHDALAGRDVAGGGDPGRAVAVPVDGILGLDGEVEGEAVEREGVGLVAGEVEHQQAVVFGLDAGAEADGLPAKARDRVRLERRLRGAAAEQLHLLRGPEHGLAVAGEVEADRARQDLRAGGCDLRGQHRSGAIHRARGAMNGAATEGIRPPPDAEVRPLRLQRRPRREDLILQADVVAEPLRCRDRDRALERERCGALGRDDGDQVVVAGLAGGEGEVRDGLSPLDRKRRTDGRQGTTAGDEAEADRELVIGHIGAAGVEAGGDGVVHGVDVRIQAARLGAERHREGQVALRVGREVRRRERPVVDADLIHEGGRFAGELPLLVTDAEGVAELLRQRPAHGGDAGGLAVEVGHDALRPPGAGDMMPHPGCEVRGRLAGGIGPHHLRAGEHQQVVGGPVLIQVERALAAGLEEDVELAVIGLPVQRADPHLDGAGFAVEEALGRV